MRACCSTQLVPKPPTSSEEVFAPESWDLGLGLPVAASLVYSPFVWVILPRLQPIPPPPPTTSQIPFLVPPPSLQHPTLFPSPTNSAGNNRTRTKPTSAFSFSQRWFPSAYQSESVLWIQTEEGNHRWVLLPFFPVNPYERERSVDFHCNVTINKF